MKPSEVLEKALEGISDPERWCKGEYGLDANGFPQTFSSVRGRSKVARACSVGHLALAANYPIPVAEHSEAFHYLAKAARVVGGEIWERDKLCNLRSIPESPFAVNDYGEHADVLKMFRLAIDYAKAEGN